MSKNWQILILAAAVCFGLTFETNAQTRRKRSTRRAATTRARQTPPPVIQPEIISLGADEFGTETNTNSNNQSNTTNANGNTAARPNQNQRTNRTTAKTNAQNDNDNGLRALEQLTQAEERAQNLRQQLSDSMEKESNLRSRVEELDFQMRPENIERETALVGSLRPEQVREARRRQLENEKTRINEQIARTLENRQRLETAIASFDALIGKLRARVDANGDNPGNATNPANNSTTNPATNTETNNQNTARPDNNPPE